MWFPDIAGALREIGTIMAVLVAIIVLLVVQIAIGAYYAGAMAVVAVVFVLGRLSVGGK